MADQDYGTVLQYTGDGSTTTYAVSFPVLSAGDVCVEVDKTPVTYTYNSGTAIVTLDSAPASGAAVVVFRSVGRENLDHTFVDRNVIRNQNLDANFLRLLYAAQEMADQERTGVSVPVVIWEDIENVPTEFPPAAHSHVEADISDLDKYSQAVIDAQQAAQDARLTALENATPSGDWDDITNKPAEVVNLAADQATQDGRLDALEATPPGGEVNTTSNEGAGAGLALPKVGQNLPFKTLVAGSNVTLTEGADTITVASSGGGGGPGPGGGQVDSVVGGTDITVDNTDPENPIVNYTGTGGGGGGSLEVDMAVIQSARITETGVVDWSSEDGWSCVLVAPNVFNITFPTAAPSAIAQSIVATTHNDSSAQPDTTSCAVQLVTETTCQVRTFYNGNTKAALDFFIHRRLPDTPVLIGVAEDSETITVKKEVPAAFVSDQFVVDLTDYQDGTRVVIEGWVKGLRNEQVQDVLVVALNGDTVPGNYYNQTMHASSNNFVTRGAGNLISYIGGALPAECYSYVKIVIEDYATAGYRKLISCSGKSVRVTNNPILGEYMVYHDTDTDPVTEIMLDVDGGEGIEGTLTAYIEKAGVLPAIPTAQGKHEIQTITDPVSGEFDFTAIPQIYKRVWVEGEIVADNGGTNQEDLTVFLNGDTTRANYTSGRFYQAGSNNFSNAVGSDTIPGYVSRTGGPTDNVTSFGLKIENYSDASKRHNAKVEYLCYRTENGSIDGTGRTTPDTAGAITEININAASNLLGTLTLYGEY